MAGMKFKIDVDIEKLNQLKTKMDEVKRSMADMSKEFDPKKFKETEKALKDMEKQYEQLSQQVQKNTEQVAQSGQVSSDTVKGVNKTLKEAIQEQKQLIKEISKDYDDLKAKSKDKNLSPSQRSDAAADALAARRALGEEKGALIGMQKQQIAANAAEAASAGGLAAAFSKLIMPLLSAAVAFKTVKDILESTEKTGHMLETNIAQLSAGLGIFFKTITTGDWTNFLDGLEQAVTGAKEYVDQMEIVNNMKNQQKIHSSVLDIKIGQAYADSYSTDPTVQKKALEEVIKLNKEKYTGEAKIARETYEAKAKDIADRNGWNKADLENTIKYYSEMKEVIENGERYIALMQSRKANAGGMVGETYVKGNAKELANIDAQLLQIPNGNYAAGIARSFEKVTFPERDEVAGLLATANTAEAQVDLNNKRIQMRLRSLRTQEESAAAEASKRKIQYEIEVGRRRVDTALDIEQQVINAEKDGIEKSRHQADLNYKKTMAELEQRKAEMLRKQNEQSGGIDIKTGKKTKSYSSKLNPADQGQLDQLGTLAASVRDKAILDQLLIDFETFQQKRLRISEEFDKKIKLLADTPAAAEAEYQKQEALDALDKQIAGRSAIYTRWAKDLAAKSLDDMSSMLKDYESMSVKLNKDGSLTDDDKAVLREQVRALQARIQELTSDKNVTKETKKDNTDTLRALNEINEATRNIINSFGDMDESSKALFTSIANISGGAIAALTGIGKVGKAAFLELGAAEKASVVLAIIGAILQVYNGIKDAIKSIAGAKEAQLTADREEYLNLVAYNEELRSKYEWTKKIGEATLDYMKREGEELAKQSAENEKLQSDLWAKLQKSTFKDQVTGWYTGQGSIAGYGKHEGNIALAGKTYEEIGELAAKGKLSKEGQAYYEALKKAKEEGIDLAKSQEDYLEKVKELYTGTTKEAITSSIIEGFKAGKRGAADFAETFGDLMRNSMLSVLALMSEDAVNKWRDQFAAASEGGLTEEEIAKLKKDYDAMINKASIDANNLEKVTGVSLTEPASTSSTSGTSASSNFSSMSQDTGDELNGRFTALQMSGQNIEQYNLSIDTNMKSLLDVQIIMGDNVAKQIEYMEMGHQVQLQSMWHLQDIAKYTKVLPTMAENIEKVRKNTERL